MSKHGKTIERTSAKYYSYYFNMLVSCILDLVPT